MPSATGITSPTMVISLDMLILSLYILVVLLPTIIIVSAAEF